MIIHYNCTIGSFLLHYFLLIYHPYPPSFHEMIFTLVCIYLTAISEKSRVTSLFGSQQLFQQRLHPLSTVLWVHSSCLYCDKHTDENASHCEKRGHHNREITMFQRSQNWKIILWQVGRWWRLLFLYSLYSNWSTVYLVIMHCQVISHIYVHALEHVKNIDIYACSARQLLDNTRTIIDTTVTF